MTYRHLKKNSVREGDIFPRRYGRSVEGNPAAVLGDEYTLGDVTPKTHRQRETPEYG